jgi:hypothetical protein
VKPRGLRSFCDCGLRCAADSADRTVVLSPRLAKLHRLANLHWLAIRSSCGSPVRPPSRRVIQAASVDILRLACQPRLACHPKLALFAGSPPSRRAIQSRYGGHPSRASMSEGWWPRFSPDGTH